MSKDIYILVTMESHPVLEPSATRAPLKVMFHELAFNIASRPHHTQPLFPPTKQCPEDRERAVETSLANFSVNTRPGFTMLRRGNFPASHPVSGIAPPRAIEYFIYLVTSADLLKYKQCPEALSSP